MKKLILFIFLIAISYINSKEKLFEGIISIDHLENPIYNFVYYVNGGYTKCECTFFSYEMGKWNYDNKIINYFQKNGLYIGDIKKPSKFYDKDRKMIGGILYFGDENGKNIKIGEQYEYKYDYEGKLIQFTTKYPDGSIWTNLDYKYYDNPKKIILTKKMKMER